MSNVSDSWENLDLTPKITNIENNNINTNFQIDSQFEIGQERNALIKFEIQSRIEIEETEKDYIEKIITKVEQIQNLKNNFIDENEIDALLNNDCAVFNITDLNATDLTLIEFIESVEEKKIVNDNCINKICIDDTTNDSINGTKNSVTDSKNKDNQYTLWNYLTNINMCIKTTSHCAAQCATQCAVQCLKNIECVCFNIKKKIQKIKDNQSITNICQILNKNKYRILGGVGAGVGICVMTYMTYEKYNNMNNKINNLENILNNICKCQNVDISQQCHNYNSLEKITMFESETYYQQGISMISPLVTSNMIEQYHIINPYRNNIFYDDSVNLISHGKNNNFFFEKK
jgi:hypothetical protein